MKIEPTVAAIATADALNAQPSWCSDTASRAAKMTAMIARTWTGSGTCARPVIAIVQITWPTTSAIAAHPSGPATRFAPRADLVGRLQLQERRAVQQAQPEEGQPGPQAERGQQVKKLPVKSWLLSIGRPASRSPRPTPISSGISALPIVMHQVQVVRHRGSSLLP